MIVMPDIPEEAKRRIVELDSATLIELFQHCIETDELPVADYILNNLMETLTKEQQDQIYAIFQTGADRALNEALTGVQLQ